MSKSYEYTGPYATVTYGGTVFNRGKPTEVSTATADRIEQSITNIGAGCPFKVTSPAPTKYAAKKTAKASSDDE